MVKSAENQRPYPLGLGVARVQCVAEGHNDVFDISPGHLCGLATRECKLTHLDVLKMDLYTD